MQLMPVKSSRILALGYDETTWTCFVQFRPTARESKGPVYAYADVPPELFLAFLSAPSLGRFFGQHLADRTQHPSLRLGEPHPVTHPALASGPGRSKLDAAKPDRATAAAGQRAMGAQRRSKPHLYRPADAELEQLERERQKLLAFFRPMRDATLAAHQAVLAQEEEALAQFEEAENKILQRLAAYEDRPPAKPPRKAPVSRLRSRAASHGEIGSPGEAA